MVPHGGEVDDSRTEGLLGAGAIEGGSDIGPVEAVEAHRQDGEHPAQAGDIAGWVEADWGGVRSPGTPNVVANQALTGDFRVSNIVP
jgi:hypothetical protein